MNPQNGIDFNALATLIITSVSAIFIRHIELKGIRKKEREKEERDGKRSSPVNKDKQP